MTNGYEKLMPIEDYEYTPLQRFALQKKGAEPSIGLAFEVTHNSTECVTVWPQPRRVWVGEVLQ